MTAGVERAAVNSHGLHVAVGGVEAALERAVGVPDAEVTTVATAAGVDAARVDGDRVDGPPGRGRNVVSRAGGWRSAPR